MSKTFNVQEWEGVKANLRKRLAKHLRETAVRVADEIQDLAKREGYIEELKKNGLIDEAHFEPGVHENAEMGTDPHMEPGGHEQFALNPPAAPDAATAEPITGGSGVPPGQLGDGAAPPAAVNAGTPMDPATAPCPLCTMPDDQCQCVHQMMAKNFGFPGLPGQGAAPAAAAATAGAPSGIAPNAGAPMAMSEDDGRNGDPGKSQPSPAEPGTVLPHGGGKVVESHSGSVLDPKGNSPLGKMAVPEAKPPSGKAPGASMQPPIASNTSKPGLTKAVVPMAPAQQAQQHGLMAASHAAATAAVPGGQAPVGNLTHPADMSRANAHHAALAGAFQPAGPVHSGLELAPHPGHTAPAMAGHPGGFLKSERCVFCGKAEHAGSCAP